MGTIDLALVGQAPSGALYRLRDAIITVQGPTSTTIWNTEDTPDQTSLSANVVVGDYSASLQDGWRLERLGGPVTTPVASQLASDNPVPFTVTALQRTSVPLQFRVNAEVVDMSQGYDIVVTVEESPPLLAVANTFGDGFGLTTSVEVFAASANGNASPLRAIEGTSSQIVFPSGVAVAGGQLIVSDLAFNAINFYPTTATGDVAPSRRIVGSSTELSSPIGLAVFDGEIYVAQAGGSIVVFPLTAEGNVAPSRILFTGGASPRLAIDRGEIYVASGFSAIAVYPTTAVGFPQPSRLIFTAVSCASGIVARGGAIFLADACDAGVRVLPEAASGFVVPLRTIAGPRTGLGGNGGGVFVFGGELYVSDASTRSVRVFPASADGDVFPTRVITGGATSLTSPFGVFVF